jgi:hypothetical protein
MIAGVALAIVGAIFCVFSLIEIALVLFSTGGATRSVFRSITGGQEPDVSQMKQAMAWVHVLAFLVFGGTMLVVGLSVLGA